MGGIRLVLDLGDAFTKGVALENGHTRRLRYPSFIAHRLVPQTNEASDLVIDPQTDIPRRVDFEPDRYPRIRSYPQGRAFVGAALPRSGSRFAGWLAAAYGADRRPLGTDPSLANIEALVHKALILLTASGVKTASVELELIVDIGPKAEAILEYARSAPHHVRFAVESFGRHPPRTVELQIEAVVHDAADCALSALPSALDGAVTKGVLLIDIGYLRTKLAVISEEGCDHQEQLIDLGVGECVRRILRDEQDQDLIEDELAVMRALEKTSGGVLEIGGRRFDVARTLASVRRTLEEEILRACERVVAERYNRLGKSCAAAAIFGGGAALIGSGLADRIESTLDMMQSFVTRNDFFLVSAATDRAHKH
jgi:hypothetical protein